MLESDANDAVAEDADAEVQVLYKHPRETDAVDAVGSDAKVRPFFVRYSLKFITPAHEMQGGLLHFSPLYQWAALPVFELWRVPSQAVSKHLRCK